MQRNRWVRMKIAAIAAALLTGAGGVAASDTEKRVCFPAKPWSGPKAERPCAEIARVYEDGSLRVRVSDASGEIRYSRDVGARD